MGKRKKSAGKSGSKSGGSGQPPRADKSQATGADSFQSQVRSGKQASPERTTSSDSPTDSTAGIQDESNVPKKSLISRYISFGLLVGVIALLGILFYSVMAQFLIPLFLSALLVVVFRPLHRWMIEKTGGREKVSALLTTAAVLLAVLVPIGTLFVMAAAEGRQVYSQFNATKIVEGIREVRTNLNLDMPSQSDLRLIENELLELQQSVALTEAEEDRHLTALYEIEEAAKNLAVEEGLVWPDSASSEPVEIEDEEASYVETSDWEQFVICLKASRKLHAAIPRKPSGVDMTGSLVAAKEERNKALHDYQAKLGQTTSHFSKFRTSLLGGKTKAWAIELVNPSDAESEAYAVTLVDFLREKLFKISGATVSYVGSLTLGMAIMIIGLYFFLLDGPKLIEGFKGLSPIDDEHEQELVSEFGRVSRAVVVATLLSALVQGILAGIGFYFAGLDSIFLLTVLSAVLAMIPFVGAAAVWFPCCLYLYFFDNSMTAAIVLGVYGATVVSMADNVIKPFILHGQSNLHPLFALLSVLGGVSTLGPIGILIGPMVVAFLQTLLKILQREMSDLDRLANGDQHV